MNTTYFVNLGLNEGDPMSTVGTSTAFKLHDVRAELFISEDGEVNIYKCRRNGLTKKPVATGVIKANPQNTEAKHAHYILEVQTQKGSELSYWVWDHNQFFCITERAKRIRYGRKPRLRS